MTDWKEIRRRGELSECRLLLPNSEVVVHGHIHNPGKWFASINDRGLLPKQHSLPDELGDAKYSALADYRELLEAELDAVEKAMEASE